MNRAPARWLGFTAAALALVALSACEGIIGANFNRASQNGDGEGGAGDDGSPGGPGGEGGGSGIDSGSKAKDGGSPLGDGSIVTIDGGTYDNAQATLAALRFPGPLTAQGSKGYCTDSRFVWRDSDGTLHSWRASDQSQIDYTFKAPNAVVFYPSDQFIVVNKSDYSTLLVYDTTMANSQVTSLPYAYNSAGTSDGALLLSQTGTGNNQTKVQHWIAASGMTEDIGSLLSTPQPPDSFSLNEVVFPASVNIPYPLYIVNVQTKTTTSVTFDGSIGIYQTLSTPLGLVVSYARSGPTPEIRIYQGNQDNTRVEIGDELANTPPLFTDSPATEHKFIAHMALDGKNLLYASAFGIFGYSLDKATLSAVQLGPNKMVFVPDVMCVIPSQRLLVYRVQGDAVGQIWGVPLAGILP